MLEWNQKKPLKNAPVAKATAAWKHTERQQERKAATEIPTLVCVVFWKHKQAEREKERERKTLVKRHADWQWPLHVGTMQDSKRHMQVAPFQPRQRKEKTDMDVNIYVWQLLTVWIEKQARAESEYVNI